MFKFIKYCLLCMCLTISAAFGNNPEGLTWKTGITGVLTAIVLILISFGIIYFVCYAIKKHKG